MTRPLPSLLALLLLGACAAPAPASRAAVTPDLPVYAECRAEARRTPALAAIERQRFPGNANQEARVDAARAEAIGRAYNDCLRQRGINSGSGGVEAVRRPGMF